jgi:hypothetical protein
LMPLKTDPHPEEHSARARLKGRAAVDAAFN